MTKTNIGELNLTVGFDVSYDTAYICTRLLEMYLNRQPDKTLKVYCDECGNWDLQIENRIAEWNKREGDQE